MSSLIKLYENILNKPRVPFFKTLKDYIPVPAFRPSGLGSPCLRKIYYHYHRVADDFGMDVLGKSRCLHGDYIHEMLSNIFRKAGVIIDYYKPDGSIKKDFFTGEDDLEFPLQDIDLEMKAKIDAVMILDAELWLGEWKSINNNGFSRLNGKPKDEHLIQAALYLFTFNKALQDGKYSHIKELNGFTEIKGIIVLYYNKDKDIMTEIPITKASDIFIKIVEKMQIVKQYTENDKVPPTTPDWCKSCNWRTKCMNGFRVKKQCSNDQE